MRAEDNSVTRSTWLSRITHPRTAEDGLQRIRHGAAIGIGTIGLGAIFAIGEPGAFSDTHSTITEPVEAEISIGDVFGAMTIAAGSGLVVVSLVWAREARQVIAEKQREEVRSES